MTFRLGRFSRMLLALPWVGAVVLAGPPPVTLLDLQFQAVAGTERIVLRSDVPIGSYKPYQYALGKAHRFVLDLPYAAHRLRPSYKLEGRLLREATVSRVEEEGVVRTRILLELSDGADHTVEVRGSEMTLTFEAQAKDGGEPLATVASADRPVVPAGSAGPPAVPVVQDYRIGVGDVLKVTVFEHPELSGTFRVEVGGVVQFPLAGRVKAEGATVLEFQAGLRAILDRDYIVNPQLTVAVEDYQSQSVDVTGAVRQPGRYYLKGATRLQDILSMAGGAAAEAGEEITVTRGRSGGEPIRILRTELYGGARPELNIVLIPGDVIDLGAREGITITGEVAKPGSYGWHPNLTVLEAIALAGGTTVWAKDRLDILRAQTRIEVDIDAIRKGKMKDVVLQPGDHVSVRRRIL